MSDNVGRFAGKVVFGTTGGGVPTRYLTTLTVRQPGKKPIRFAAMAATAVTAGERCLLYVRGDRTIALQLGSLQWVALHEDLGFFIATGDPASAAPLSLDGSPAGRTLQVATRGGLVPVYYAVGDPPVLTINGGEGTESTFAPTTVTPSLEAINRAKSCRNADLADVDLRDADLAHVDLTASSLARARLDGASLTGAILTGAAFTGADVGSARFDDAVLDSASFDGADLTGSAWGAPRSARGIVLTNCCAGGSVLGGQPKPLDCTEANLAGGDFRGADLRGLLLPNASARNAKLSGARLDNVVLDGAALDGAIADGATLASSSLRGASAQGASFAHADLTDADLTRVRMGSKAWLFALDESFEAALETKPYAQPELVTAFRDHGVRISAEDPVSVLAAGQRWRVIDAHGPYDLLLNRSTKIDVFDAGPARRPTVLRAAICRQARASGASLAGADLREVLWCGEPARLDHADLEDAALAGADLTETDLTQAILTGADLSGTVLVQSKMRGCVFASSASGRACSLEGALLHGADFTDAVLRSALLIDAAVATARGVPLLRLPLSARTQLTPTGLSALARLFEAANRPLGTSPAIDWIKQWLLDDSANADPGMPRTYRVQLTAGQLRVYDAARGPMIFTLPMSQEPALDNPRAPDSLVEAFTQAGRYTLASSAPITAQPYWEIAVDSDAPVKCRATYERLRVYSDVDALPVYGAVLVEPHGGPTPIGTLAFGPTSALDSALDAGSIGPNGAPRSWSDERLITLEELFTAHPGCP